MWIIWIGFGIIVVIKKYKMLGKENSLSRAVSLPAIDDKNLE